MKTLMQGMSLKVFGFLLISLVIGCGKEAPSTPNEKAEQFLRSTTWILSSLKVDNVNSNRFSGMTLQFGTGIYSTAGGEPVWPRSGTWAFEGQSGNRIRRNDGLIIDILGVSAAQITLAFDWAETTYEFGRISSTAGRHEMVFVKK